MSDQEIFSPDELTENIQRKRELIELVASKEAVLMVGAGSSVRVGYVNWDGLLNQLEDLAGSCGNGFARVHSWKENDPLGYAARLKSHIQCYGAAEMYSNLIYDLFKTRSPACDGFHRTLVSLPFRGLLTTNYDTVLEAALGLQETESAHDNSLVISRNTGGRVNEFLMKMNNDKRFPHRIAHLHGRFDFAESIILDSKDYEDAYDTNPTDDNGERKIQNRNIWTLHRKLLWAVLATRRVVFVGFSMNDPYFNEMLKIVSADLWRWEKSIHYAINSIARDSAKDTKISAEHLKSRYGVATVFYEVVGNDHTGLDHIIDEIAKECGDEVQFASVSRGATGSEKTTEEEDSPRSIESASLDLLDWLKRANKRSIGRIENEN